MISPEDIRLVETCGACPEQYDAFVGDREVGYLRLRHGRFTVQCPDVGGEYVYVAHPKGDGVFENEERYGYLNEAKAAIADWVNADSAQKAVDEWSGDGE